MRAPTVVLKFGGTSVSTRERWETIRDTVRDYIEAGERPFVVCSALSGVSNLLEGLLEAALEAQHEPILQEISARHAQLAADLGVDADVSAELESLGRWALGASLIREVSPRLKAMVMATGELMSTRLGAAFLEDQGVSASWRDARLMLVALQEPNANPERHYLSSPCDFSPDAALRAALEDEAADVILTQGFIARDQDGDTVLLGRGGSDTSAAYFAAKLGAQRLEIWTDVPGMFTANPREIGSARLLRRLDYQEAQELATMGAKVLHPRCLAPVRAHDIPLLIKCTPHPELEGTTISSDVPDFGPQVKAVSSKSGIPLVSMETLGMWQQVGFLADVFGAFKDNGLSIDQVATSETNVTVSLDPVANALDRARLDGLLEDLEGTCVARQIGPCAAVSLVGRDIRAILHKLGPALEVFEQQRVYIMSQASSDLNLTFVVDEDQAERLVSKLHALVFGDRAPDELIGPTWRELFSDGGAGEAGASRQSWWFERRDELLALARPGRPTYVYDAPTLHRSIDALYDLDALSRRYYAIKANPNPEILSLFAARGVCLECVSPGEVVRALEHVEPDRVMFTPNFAPIGEYEDAFALGVHVTLDNLHPLEQHPEVFRGQKILVRLDPGVGRGHHKKVRTAGTYSKFGVPTHQLERLRTLASQSGVEIIGVHTHVGSGIRSSETWAENAVYLASVARRLGPSVRILNLGGGLGVPERPSEQALDIGAVAASLRVFKEANPEFELWLEPGRFCVAQAGALLTTVTQLKSKGEQVYVGVDTGMNSLIRPSLYGAFHEIINLTRPGQPTTITADVVGPICETGDVLGRGRRLPITREGDVLLIGTTGAYGRAMSSEYNLRPPAREVLLDP